MFSAIVLCCALHLNAFQTLFRCIAENIRGRVGTDRETGNNNSLMKYLFLKGKIIWVRISIFVFRKDYDDFSCFLDRVDDKKGGKSISSIYIASDSRYSWGKIRKDDYGIQGIWFYLFTLKYLGFVAMFCFLR